MSCISLTLVDQFSQLMLLLLQVSDTLKRFALKVTTASVKERKEIFGQLKQCIKGKGEGFCGISFT